jgi:hypothetical protein
MEQCRFHLAPHFEDVKTFGEPKCEVQIFLILGYHLLRGPRGFIFVKLSLLLSSLTSCICFHVFEF